MTHLKPKVMLPNKIIYHALIILSISGLMSSCASKKLMEMLGSEQKQLSADLKHLRESEAEEVSIGWKLARAKALNEGLELKRVRSRLEDLKRQRRNLWREWLPRPSLYLSLQSRMRDLGDMNRDDLAVSFYAPLAIPNPVTARARAYSYALQELQAEDSLEVSRRRQVVLLYRLFREWQYLEADQESSRGKGDSVEGEIQMALIRRENQVNREERKAMLQLRLSKTLNMPGVRIIPDVSALPEFDYSNDVDEFIPGENYGQLGIRLMSYQIVGALLRSKGIKLSQWSAPYISVGLPSLYDSRREGEELLGSTEQINLFSSWNKSFDMTGRVAAGLENADEQVGFMRESLRQQLDQDSYEWEKLKRRYELVSQKEQLSRSRLQRLLSRSRGDVASDMQDVRRIVSDLRNLERAKTNLDMEVWIWDDKAWK